MSTTLPLTLACSDYDRTRALRDGDIRPDGIDLTYLALPVEETFFRMLRHREFDVAEMSLSSYAVTRASEDPWLVAIPVFPSRAFRHSSVYVNRDCGIERPSDLRGKVVGTPEFQLTACVWIRGILAEEHGVPFETVSYRTGGLEVADRAEKLPLALGPGLDVRPLGNGLSLSEALATGVIDALQSPRAPSCFERGAPGVERLWPDARLVEEDWFERTRIFPIMHTLVIRRDLYERHPWIAGSLQKAFTLARDRVLDRLGDMSALPHMSPWLALEHERTLAVMGDDFWSYGLEPNRHVLETFLRFHHEQGLSRRLLEPGELFAPETLEAYAI